MSSSAASPYAPGVLPAAHESQIVKIQTCLRKWLSAQKDKRSAAPKLDFEQVSNDLLALTIDPPYAFTSEPAPPPSHAALLSIAKCYWLALVTTLTAPQKDEVARRLDRVPPFGTHVPKFDGRKSVDAPGDLDAREYEGLMRVAVFVLLDMEGLDDVVDSWKELADVGVQVWDEDGDESDESDEEYDEDEEGDDEGWVDTD
ncbi:hypothetical protein PLICRDRAFT_58529 [Plicaturopsis crispa FD-325 SS-3]|uniref:Uncharacterized protein n=1 Tax=Plicaturopsis crispa FD-325 SS-3 TaxID=944288 RepID=A0A0C9SVU4_PLICR|nr:hypothetical protein PLICRDRAFT_58529 [Plicaturopsis crispa FD-325 SS-3]